MLSFLEHSIRRDYEQFEQEPNHGTSYMQQIGDFFTLECNCVAGKNGMVSNDLLGLEM